MYEEETDTKCPKCDKPATKRVIKRDGQCSRCTQGDERERNIALSFALTLVNINPAEWDKLPAEAYARTVWTFARALAKEERNGP